MARVLILQELIAGQLEREGLKLDREALRYAAMTHDVGRLDDGKDLEHGTRSAQWIKENLSNKMSPETLDIATYIVHWHVPSDGDAPVMTEELKVLKDADGLDRVRLGDLDPNYLRTEPAKKLLKVAERLYDLSVAPEGTNEPNSFSAVLSAAGRMGIIER